MGIGNVENYLPSIFVSGMSNRHGVDGTDAAYNLASALLDDEDIMLITTEDDENVYYLAAHSNSFIGGDINLIFGTSLANALPYTPDHKGIGVYIYPMGEFYSVVAFLGNKIESFFASSKQIDEYIIKNEKKLNITLEIIDTLNLEPIRWVGYRTGKTLEAKIIAKKTNYICLGIILFLCCLTIFLKSFIGYYKEKPVVFYKNAMIEIKTLSDKINQNNINEIEKYFLLIQKLGNKIKNKDGYISHFSIQNNDIYWIVAVPKWVSIDDFKSISSVLYTSLSYDKNNEYIYISNKPIKK